MALGMQRGAPQPLALPTFRVPFSADPDKIRVGFRLTGGVLVVAGALYLSMVVLDFLAGKAGLAMLTTIGAAASLVGGTRLLAQRYSAGPDTVRRSTGTLGLALGPGILVSSLRNFGGGATGGTDPLTLLSVLNLVLGSVLVLIGAISLRSRRYSSWYNRRWDKWELRRSVRLRQLR